MSQKIKSMKIKGITPESFKKAFKSHTDDGTDSGSVQTGFIGNMDPDGRFFIVKKGRGYGKGPDYEARLTGIVSGEDGSTVIDYKSTLSPIYVACYIIIGILFALALAIGLVKAIGSGDLAAILPAPFLAMAFIIMTAITVFKPECRALEKCLDEIAQSSLEEQSDD